MKKDTQSIILSRFRFDGVIFDLDGVVTRTAEVHAKAWKALFDDFREESGGQWNPFDIDTDYSRHVDGKPRLDGVRSFLDSRGVVLREGGPDDPAGKATVHGLGKKKNRLFLNQIEEKGVELYEPAVELVRSLKDRAFRTAVVSSSRNCRAILTATGTGDLFDITVDGTDSEKLGLKGKPAPDIFLEAANRLRVRPERAVVLEDALSGVEAGRQGGFGRVIGVDRTGHGADLLKKGAHLVVNRLSEVVPASRLTRELPSALDRGEALFRHFNQRSPVVFLDYDGTLTPIVEDPKKALLQGEMRETLQRLSELYTVGIISGRDLKDVEGLVGLQKIVYAGSHGFEIAQPGQDRRTFQKGTDYLKDLDAAEESLREKISPIQGAYVERKKYSIALHYRKAGEEDLQALEKAVDRVHTEHPRLRKDRGKKIFELQPDIDWNKGKALLWIMETLRIKGPEWIPVYMGDDVTDEYGFGAVQEPEIGGTGIVVTEENRFSEAGYILKNQEEVRIFLQTLISLKDPAGGGQRHSP